MPIDYNRVGIRIKRYRLDKHLTQEQLGELIHSSAATITAIERGVKAPSIETLINIANTLEVSADDTAENGIDDTIVPLFELYGGNKNNALFQDEQEGHFILTGSEIEECVRTTGAKVIFIDPWQQFVNGISTSDNAALRNMVCDIQLAAERMGAAVILAGNFIKGLLPDINRGIGGTELYNTLRCILTLRPDDEDDSSVRILEATKMSLMGKESTPIIIRQDEDLGLTFESYDALDEEDVEEPMDFLLKTLESGPQDSRKIMELGSERGLGSSQMYRLRKKAGIIIEKQPDRSSQWKLPT